VRAAIEKRTALCQRRRNQPSGREGRMRAVARGVEEGPAIDTSVSSACPRRVRWVDSELLGEAIDPWPLLVEMPCSFVDLDRALRQAGAGPRTGPAADR
jgi:hypothetical protein